MKNCMGCEEEMFMAYRCQLQGLNIDFQWSGGHCFLIAFDNKGNIVVE